MIYVTCRRTANIDGASEPCRIPVNALRRNSRGVYQVRPVDPEKHTPLDRPKHLDTEVWLAVKAWQRQLQLTGKLTSVKLPTLEIGEQIDL